MSDIKEDDSAWLWCAAAFSIATAVVEPFVVRTLWRWFIVPLGVRPITWASAFGFNLIVHILIYRYPGKRSNEATFEACTAAFFSALLILGIGWFVVKVTA